MTQHQVYTTDQQIFDIAATHLLKQGRRATAPAGGCRYRAVQPDGAVLKCAVGALIPDELYEPDLENWQVGSLVTISPIRGLFQTPKLDRTVSMLRELQCLHDETLTKPFRWRLNLGRIANRYDLNTQVLDDHAA